MPTPNSSGTHLWGDTVFGVRFLSPVLGALTSLLLVRFLAREANGVVACLSVLVATATPLLMVGATLMTIDCLSVLFWMAASSPAGAAVRHDSTRAWIWTGLWMGLGFLGKYIALFPVALLARVFPALAASPDATPASGALPGAADQRRLHVACRGLELPTSLGNRGSPRQPRRAGPRLAAHARFFWDFLAAEAFLLNPVLFVGAIWAAAALWFTRGRAGLPRVYLFCMGVPLILFYLFYTFRARVQPNWIAPAVLPLFA